MTLRRAFAPILPLFLIVLTGTWVGGAWAHEGAHKIRIKVESVLAANTAEGMDQRLAHTTMGDRLQALFEFSTYRLLYRQEQNTVIGRMVAFELPGGRILHIAPRGIEDGMIAMELILFDGARPIMSTDVKLMNHGILIVGGPRYQQGMLITAITTDTPNADAAAVKTGGDRPLSPVKTTGTPPASRSEPAAAAAH